MAHSLSPEAADRPGRIVLLLIGLAAALGLAGVARLASPSITHKDVGSLTRAGGRRLPLTQEPTISRGKESRQGARGGSQHQGAREPAGDAFPLTAIVPAFNEAETVADTISSLQGQTLPPVEIFVVDDCSTDDTGAVAEAAGVRVVRPPANTGSKAGAQTFALQFVTTEFVMALDSDTTLAPDAVERLSRVFANPEIAAASGSVLPRRVSTVWERGRYVEYMFAFSFFKRIQDHYGKPLISSGCFSLYRTNVVREVGGWSDRTTAEDMDLTWTLYQRGWKVRFVPQAVCYPIEPCNLDLLRKQLRRWSHGFVQNVKLHWRGVLGLGYLRSMVALAFWDSAIASVAYLFAIPLLAAFVSPLFWLAYVVDGPVLLLPVVVDARKRHEIRRAFASFPAYFPLRVANAVMMLKAVVFELVLRRPLLVYEKGH
ncbi:MAG TPA: glycosyltransferase [Thermoleophilaceae bacterium]|nr:glycosyltransferase [Thermoleophilaceae bacterium]